MKGVGFLVTVLNIVLVPINLYQYRLLGLKDFAFRDTNDVAEKGLHAFMSS